MNPNSGIPHNAATAKICRQIVKAFGHSVFTMTRAHTVSRKLLGDFAFPRLLCDDTGTKSNCWIEDTAVKWDTLAANTQDGIKAFPEVHTLLFFLELLSMGRKLLYRGQKNAEWGLESTLTRRLNQGWDAAAMNDAKVSFIRAVHELPDRRHLTLLPQEQESLCQHYGFPTDFLDFTWSLDVAAFFALGGFEAYERGSPAHEAFDTGSLWVIDTMGRPGDDILIASIGRGFLRPSLQRGEFLRLPEGSRASVTKFVFNHSAMSWADSIDGLGPNSSASFAAYLMPARDPVAEASLPFLKELENHKRRDS